MSQDLPGVVQLLPLPLGSTVDVDQPNGHVPGSVHCCVREAAARNELAGGCEVNAIDGDVGRIGLHSEKPAMQPRRINGDRTMRTSLRQPHAAPGTIEQLISYPSSRRPEDPSFPLLADDDRQLCQEIIDSVTTPDAARENERHQRGQDQLARGLPTTVDCEERTKHDVRSFVEPPYRCHEFVDGRHAIEVRVAAPVVGQRPPAQGAGAEVEDSAVEHALDAEDRGTPDHTPDHNIR